MSVAAPARVPFVDLGRVQEPIAAELRTAVDRVVERGDFVLGDEVGRFEQDFAAYVGVAHCVGVASGTAALTIALEALGIGPGDEVLVPAHTFVASALAVIRAGAEPVLCDVDRANGLLDLESAETVVGPRSAAIMAVHLYGQACDMEAVGAFAARHGLVVVEDAAQAHGAAWGARKVGSFGAASAFSFYPSKNLGAFGDAGAIVTDDPAVAARARRLSNLGQESKGVHVEVGHNERLDTLQAAVLRVKLPHLERWNDARRAAAALYASRLPAETVVAERRRARDVFHLFPALVTNRDQIAATLADAGVDTGVHYFPAIHQQAAYRGLRRADLPAAERWARKELSLPMFPGLSEREVDRVCDALGAALARRVR